MVYNQWQVLNPSTSRLTKQCFLLGSQEQQSADTSQPATDTPDDSREASQQQTEHSTPQESADGPMGDQPSPEGQEEGAPKQQGEQVPPPEQNASSGGEGNSKESPQVEKKKVYMLLDECMTL